MFVSNYCNLKFTIYLKGGFVITVLGDEISCRIFECEPADNCYLKCIVRHMSKNRDKHHYYANCLFHVDPSVTHDHIYNFMTILWHLRRFVF